MSTSIQEFDDLTKITGIGDSIQQRLRTSLHVQSYADLAVLPVDTIEADLKAEKSIPAPLKTRKKIEVWQNEARQLVEIKEPYTQKEKNVWEPIDSFVLEFQRRKNMQGDWDFRVAVQHVEHDANYQGDFRKTQEREALFMWMENEANIEEMMKSSPPTSNRSDRQQDQIEVMPEFSWHKDLKLAQISMTQGEESTTTMMVNQVERPFLGHIHHEQPLDLEAVFTLPYLPTKGDSSFRYKAQCQIHNLSQGLEPTYMDMKTTEEPGDKPRISTKLSDVSLEPGIYEVGILVRGERPLGANYYKFPKLNVL